MCPPVICPPNTGHCLLSVKGPEYGTGLSTVLHSQSVEAEADCGRNSADRKKINLGTSRDSVGSSLVMQLK